jgi:tetratricopeptide (TPR) repeat protein
MLYSFIPPLIIVAAIAVIIFILIRRLPQTRKLADKTPSESSQKRPGIFKLTSQKFSQWRAPKKSASFRDRWQSLKGSLAAGVAKRREQKGGAKKDPAVRVAEAKREIAKKVEAKVAPAPVAIKTISEAQKSEIRNLSWEARKAVKKNEFTEAEKYYRQILKINKDDIDAYKGLGNVYMKMENFSDAADAYRNVIRLGGRNEKVYLELGECLLKKKDFKEAIEALEQVLKLNSQSAAGYALLGQAHTADGLHKEALKSFQRAVELDEKNVGYLILLTEASERRGLKVEAKMYLRKVLELEPANLEAKEKLDKLG